MSQDRRCPNCGALVVGDAKWCGQCYAPLGGSAAPAEPPLEIVSDDTMDELLIDIAELELSEQPDGPSATPAPTAGPPTTVPGPKATGVDTNLSIRKVGEVLLWTCPQCELDNPMESAICSRCGTPFASILSTPETEQRPLPEPRSALISSLLLPGLGHIRVGHAAEGIARLILFLWAGGLGLMMLLSLGAPDPAPGTVPSPATQASRPGAIVAVGMLFVVGAIAVWAVSALDAQRLARRETEQLLSPRILLVGTIALTVLSIGAFVAAGFSVSGAAR